MNLSQLRYFRKLAQLQHYTKAAEELFITQPALSNSIKQLESELGIPLFEQRGRNVRLTRRGREFYSYINEGLEIIDKGIEVAQEHANNLSGSIDIGTIYTVQADFLPMLMNRYREEYGPQVEIRFYQGLTASLLDGVEQGQYDLAICAYEDHHPALEFVPILFQSLIVVVHKDHPLAAKQGVSLSDLTNCNVVTYRPDVPVGKNVMSALEGIDVKITRVCDDEITLGSMVAADANLVGLSLDTLGLTPFSELVKIPLVDIDRDFHRIYLVYGKTSFKTRAVENMIDLAKSLND